MMLEDFWDSVFDTERQYHTPVIHPLQQRGVSETISSPFSIDFGIRQPH